LVVLQLGEVLLSVQYFNCEEAVIQSMPSLWLIRQINTWWQTSA